MDRASCSGIFMSTLGRAFARNVWKICPLQSKNKQDMATNTGTWRVGNENNIKLMKSFWWDLLTSHKLYQSSDQNCDGWWSIHTHLTFFSSVWGLKYWPHTVYLCRRITGYSRFFSHQKICRHLISHKTYLNLAQVSTETKKSFESLVFFSCEAKRSDLKWR